jgi:hypothetical protein
MEQYAHWRSVLEFYGRLPINGKVHEMANARDVSDAIVIPKRVVLNSVYNFPDYIKEMLEKDGIPLLTQEIRERFIRDTGKDIDLKNFSSKMNTVRKRGHIVNVSYPDLPLDKRHYWGLKEWIHSSGGFKEQYKRRRIELHGL